MFNFGRDLCNYLPIAEEREWLVTNGIGGYASGTVAGLLTRRYHGLLIAALEPPLGRTLLLAKLDETVSTDGHTFPLFANRWSNGELNPTGFHYLERFFLEGAVPVWTYAYGNILLEKRVWMQPGANTTYIRYDLRRGKRAVVLTLKAIVNYRDHHHTTPAGTWQMQVNPVEHGLQIESFEKATPFYLLSSQAEVIPQHSWYRNYHLALEADRGLDSVEDHLHVATFRAVVYPHHPLTLVASLQPDPNLDGESAYDERRAYEQRLVTQIRTHFKAESPKNTPSQASLASSLPDWVEHLALAADQFVVSRSLPDGSKGHTVIAGYPWFGDWGRDTMISLSGLLLTTGRPQIAQSMLRTYARFVDQGMLPNRFPDAGQPSPDYNAVDAALWYVEAVRAYHAATGDDALLQELFPILQEIIDWHQRGTRYSIKVDPADGLLFAGEAGIQLTWMDAKVGDWVVTPRQGKPVEVNALWYNALRTMANFSRHLNRPVAPYQTAAQKANKGFERFWNPSAGCCYDLLDGPDRHDATLRPNQILAVALPHSPLETRQQRAVVDICIRHLLTPYGLRSLAPTEADYVGRYRGNQHYRDGAYHQGTVWSWLIGPFVLAHLRVYRDPALAQTYLQPLISHITGNGIGSISEIFDGDPPFAGRGCPAQAWSVAELLRAWHEVTRTKAGR